MDTIISNAPSVIPGSSIAAMWFTFFVATILPFLGWFFLAKKWKSINIAIMAGALGFFIPQILIRIPLLSALPVSQTLTDLYGWNALLYFLTMAFTAGLFETTGRLFVFKSLLKNRLSYQTGVSAGYGHGAIEAIVLIGMTYAGNLIVSYGANAGTLDISQDVMKQAVDQLATVPVPLFLAAGFERLCTICFHVAISVFLCYMISKGKTGKGFLLSLAAHTAVDFIIPLVQVRTGSYFITETLVFLLAIASIRLIILFKGKFEFYEIPIDPAKQAADQGY